MIDLTFAAPVTMTPSAARFGLGPAVVAASSVD
jgi:hypothetical protein